MKKSPTVCLGLGLLLMLMGGARAENFFPEIRQVALSPQGRTPLVAAATSPSSTHAVFWQEGRRHWRWDFPSAQGYLAPWPNPFLSEDVVGFVEPRPEFQMSCSLLMLPEKKVRSLGRGTRWILPVVDAVAGRFWFQDASSLRRRQGSEARFLSGSVTGQYVEVTWPGVWFMEAAADDTLYLAQSVDPASSGSDRKGQVVDRFKLVPAGAGWTLEPVGRLCQAGPRDVLVWSPQGKYVGLWRNSLGSDKPPHSEGLECYYLGTDPWRLVFKVEGRPVSEAFDEPRESAVVGVLQTDGQVVHYVANLQEGTLSPILLTDLAVVYSWRAEAEEMIAMVQRDNGWLWFRSGRDRSLHRGRLVKVGLRRQNGGYRRVREEEIAWYQ
jgi:hypothetical protein